MAGRPALSASYLRSLGASILSPPQKSSLLIIVDLNGVLLERLASSGKSRAAHREAKALRPPSFRLDGRDIWLRPYHTVFLSYIAARHTLSVWSSATPKTVSGLLAHPSFLPQGVRPAFIHTRDVCVPDTVTGGYATLKPLSAVFTGSFAERNTLIFDDSPSKVVRDPLNAVIVPEYSAGNLRVDYLRDETLLWAAVYLEHVARDFGAADDVREKVREAGGLEGLEDFITDAQGVAIAESGVASCRVFLPGAGEGLDIAAVEKVATEVASENAPGIGGGESGKRRRRRRARRLKAQNGGEADAEDRAIDDAEDAGIPQYVRKSFSGEKSAYGVDGVYGMQAAGSGERAVPQSFGGERSAYGVDGGYGVQAAGSGERAGGWYGSAVQGQDHRKAAKADGEVLASEFQRTNLSTEVEELPVLAGASRIPRAT